MKSLLVHLVLALGGLGLAYVVWTGKDSVEQAGGDETVTLVDCDLDRVSDFKFNEDATKTDVTRKTDDGASYFQGWVRADVASPSTEKDRYFNVSKAGMDMLKALAPFRADRSLGVLTATQLKELGLDHPKNAFSITCGGKTHAFDVGSTAFSSGDYYFRAKAGGPVYLVPRDKMGAILHAQAELSERDVFTGEITEVEHLAIHAADGGEKKLYQRNRQNPKTAEWVDAAVPDQRNELYGNWFARWKQMRIENFLAPGQKPGDELTKELAPRGPFKMIATFDYLDAAGRKLDTVEFGTIPGDPDTFYAKSGSTHGWTRVLGSMGKQVATDLPAVFGNESSAR